MLTRQYLKITSSTRTLICKGILRNQNYFMAPTRFCRCNNFLSSRLFFTYSKLNGTEGVTGNTIHFSPGTINNQKSNNLKESTKNYLSSEELLEKLITGLSADIHQKNRVYKNDLVRVINKIKETNFSKKKQGLLLLRCCAELLPDETAASRMVLAEQIWNTIEPHTEFEVEHYNELLRVYIANNRTLSVVTFIEQMAPVKPNINTYELFLRALGEAGDLNQSTEVISNMKAQGFPATESIFNSLIICQGRAGNVHNIQEVLSMMKSLKFDISIETHISIARALALNKKHDQLLEEMEKAQKAGLHFGETHIMEVVKTLASVGTYGPIAQMLKFLPQSILSTPSITPYMQSVCTWLVFQNHPIAALEVYKCLPLPSFGPKDDQGLHGRSLIRDCVKAAVPSSIIALIAQELMSSGRNPIAVQNAAEAALQLGKVPLALDMFTRMKQIGMPVRPHYFWPILLHTSRTYGEKGIMETLATMVLMEVKPDYDTLKEYTLPYVSFTSPQNLMKKFLDTGLTVSTVLTPMMETLLNTGQVRAASEICELFQGKVDVNILLKPLIKGYLISSDLKSTVHILEDMSEKATDKSKDWVGRFLCIFMRHKKVNEDLIDFMGLVKALKSTKLRIATSATDYCIAHLPAKYSEEVTQTFRDALVDITDESLIDEGEMFVQHIITHPKQMNEESLRAHLNELEAKSMNTRGVLRKLLQRYCREGNLKAAREIVEKCHNEGVYLSAGMKASIFDLHVKLGELDLAEITLADLNKNYPNFTLDEFKLIDFATLMVYKKKIDKAFELIKEQSKRRRVIGGQNISMNCWRLLDATAANGTHVETRQMFELLCSLRYCHPTNVLLGPLVRVHLKNNNLPEAVNEFQRIANKYSKTPLKHELLCKILQTIGDGQSEDTFLVNEKTVGKLNKLVQTVLNIDKKIHGVGDVQLTLITAFADVGYKKTLRKLFLDPSVKFHPDALLRRCERFADEKKLQALENIAECVRDLRHVHVEDIYDLILDVHQRNDNTIEALALYNRMQDAEITPSSKFVTNLTSLLRANNKDVPSELALLAQKQNKKVSNT